MISAAKAAHAPDFIMRIPQGYETPIGERAGKFSGGAKQRIAIARALLKDPGILILDEATSALDAESDALVQEALEELVKGRTTFIIAHRLSTVVNADRIVVLRDGYVMESGTHLELVKNNGYYASLVRHQTKGLLWPEGTPLIRPTEGPARTEMPAGLQYARMPEEMTPEDIARLDKKEYREPGRDLLASRPVDAKGAGARGDVTNPKQDEHSHGAPGPRQDTVGSDERAFLAEKDES